MNVLDSELVIAQLRGQGYELTDDIDQADTILYNTCSVRQHAEDKVYSALGRIKHLKQTRPAVAIGVLGCMAQKDQKQILKRAPHVDVVIGPGQISRVAELLDEARTERRPRLAVSLARNAGTRATITESFESYDPLREPTVGAQPHQAYVRVMMGCDKFCTFCIVPSVRGPEQSRPPDEILAESRRLIDQGAREIILLGQTVNSYKFRSGDGRTARLSELLHEIHGIAGLARLKFITSYPSDMTDDLLDAVRDLPRVARYIHVPAQHGCDAVLKRMKRTYTVAYYEDMLVRIRERIPGCAVSSDFIVGFCGETEAEYQRSIALAERARFKNSFIFKYSERPGTKAHGLFADDVPEEVKRRRNNDLLAVQNRVSHELNREFLGQPVDVLVDGPSDWARKVAVSSPISQLSGRTSCDRIVVFDGPPRLIGRTVPVLIREISPVTLFGDLVEKAGQPDSHRPGARLPTLPVLNS
jgi:tRNA-2-methylthio-N6-dimethylallyladenosine synthase